MQATIAAPETLAQALARLVPGSSGRTRKQMLEGGRVRVNGEIVRIGRTALKAGDRVEIGERHSARPGPRELSGELTLLYEDEDLLVVDKAAGLLTVATETERERTAYVQLTAWVRERSHDPRARVFIVHRIDRLASGLLVFARTPDAKGDLQDQLRAHTVERAYAAVVEGEVEKDEGVVAEPLVEEASGRVHVGRPGEGRDARTHYRVVRRAEGRTLLEVRLETGRKHQIRVHLAHLGHPIVGDPLYGHEPVPGARLALHARTLGFIHPRSGDPMRFESPPPASFKRLLR